MQLPAEKTPKLETLVDDIYTLFGSGKVPTDHALQELGKAIAYHVGQAFKAHDPAATKGVLRGSRIGTSCGRKQWYDTNAPESAEDMDPHTLLKFLYGNILEEIILFLAEEAGHSVEKRQATVELDGIVGHIDAIIDGTLVDVKSASGRAMGKFLKNALREDDPFGYIPQIEFYLEALKNEKSVQDEGRYAFLAVDKESGRLHLDVYEAPRGAADATRRRAEAYKAVAASAELPLRGHFPVPDGSSGNLSLSTACKYCNHKKQCWATSNGGVGLRAFKYSNGIKYLTKVVKTPLVPEIFTEDLSEEGTDDNV